MRRSLLTARPPVPLTIGNSGDLGASTWGTRILVDLTGTASRSGTITTVDTRAPNASAGNVRIFVGSLSGLNLTVRSVSPPLAATGFGVNTYSVSLAVLAGDVVGYWSLNAAEGLRYSSGGGIGSMGYATGSATPPAVSDVIALTSAADSRGAIVGTG